MSALPSLSSPSKATSKNQEGSPSSNNSISRTIHTANNQTIQMTPSSSQTSPRTPSTLSTLHKTPPKPLRPPNLPTTHPNAPHHLQTALNLLSLQTPASQKAALHNLDLAIGLTPTPHGPRPTTLSTHLGLRSLPIYLVRRVEYEALLRRHNRSEMEIRAIHDLFPAENVWYFGDVRDASAGADYLHAAAIRRNSFAKQALAWLAPDRAKGRAERDRDFMTAIARRERERAVELGRMGACGVMDVCQRIVRMPVGEQRGVAANNIGYMLRYGKGGLECDVGEAVLYYEMAVAWGNACAASNFGALLQYELGDGVRARELYERAIGMGERNFAPRNLGMLFFHGASGVRRDVCHAARCFLVGIREGDGAARFRCARSLRMVLRCWKIRFGNPDLRGECLGALLIYERGGYSPSPGSSDEETMGEGDTVFSI